ncbi:hypothetical protein AMS68_003892 [Peltaster fructicola]|uniref:Non-homologous end-joining factor 1 n=1 Tax=Peltaster fructicola TaxID=286661 RepID=A0A6H0XUP6_9PEZI|nr:hypothetical protein AMS68_003892 [Peltaster fructicola]
MYSIARRTALQQTKFVGRRFAATEQSEGAAHLKRARRDPELFPLMLIVGCTLGGAAYYFTRNPTSGSSESKVVQADKSAPWHTGKDAKYEFHPHGDPRNPRKEAPSALNEVIVPNVTLPKHLHDKYNKWALIISTHIHADGYTVYLSDLEHIWTEELTKAAVLERAAELDCSIDPSQDSEQYHIFSKKLKSAFEQEAETCLELKSLRSGTNITLLLSMPLPKPWRKLEWEVHLQRQDDGLVGSELTGPLVDRAYALQQQLTQLMTELRAKDHVLSRVIDRLEATGTTLTEVFPNVANLPNRGHNKHQPLRERLAPHVRGLAPFDEAFWTAKVEKNDRAESQAHILDEVLPRLSLKHGSNTSHKANWWRGLDISIMSSSSRSQVLTSPQLEDNTVRDLPAPPVDDSSTDDDDYEVQTTLPSSPPQLKDSSPVPDETPTKATTTSSNPVKKFAGIGGSRPATTPPVEADPLPAPSLQQSSVSPANPKSKLGAIGGKKSTKEATSEPPSVTETATLSPRPKKLGAIGGKRGASVVKQEPEDAGMSGVTTSQVKTPPPVKSEEHLSPAEKADHRRDLLKRQQEQAKPVTKKKRRF